MHFVYPNIVTEMKKRNLDYRDLAGVLDISEHAAYRRLRGLAGWKLNETLHLCDFFNVSDTAWLFECDVTERNI